MTDITKDPGCAPESFVSRGKTVVKHLLPAIDTPIATLYYIRCKSYNRVAFGPSPLELTDCPRSNLLVCVLAALNILDNIKCNVILAVCQAKMDSVECALGILARKQ